MNELENVRQKMYDNISSLGINSLEVLKISQELDILIAKEVAIGGVMDIMDK